MNLPTLRERKYQDEIEQFRKLMKLERNAWLERELQKIVPPLVYDWVLSKLPAATEYLNANNIRWEIGKFHEPSREVAVITTDLYKGTEVVATFEFEIVHDGSHSAEVLHKDIWELKK